MRKEVDQIFPNIISNRCLKTKDVESRLLAEKKLDILIELNTKIKEKKLKLKKTKKEILTKLFLFKEVFF